MGNVLDVTGPRASQVQTWHREQRCCKHLFPGGGDERACCVCDADDPCPDLLAEIDGHDCAEWVDRADQCCRLCGQPVDPGDLICTWCGRDPCVCDEAYERSKDERLGL